jgi:hypothetical protein
MKDEFEEEVKCGISSGAGGGGDGSLTFQFVIRRKVEDDTSTINQ